MSAGAKLQSGAKRSEGTQPRPAGGATAPSDGAGFTPAPAAQLDFIRDGADYHTRAATALLSQLEAVLSTLHRDRAGVRLVGLPGLADLLDRRSAIGAFAANIIGPAARPVRAILFDKSPATNWALGWHQDRTIAVREKRDVPGYGPWSRKEGIQHVEPPFALIEGMVTLRIHLDDVPWHNAPLIIAPQSHRLGKIAAEQAESKALALNPVACLARRGDIWRYATPILHASAAKMGDGRRRVLQVDYSAADLGSGLEWLGV